MRALAILDEVPYALVNASVSLIMLWNETTHIFFMHTNFLVIRSIDNIVVSNMPPARGITQPP
jgi:hypothetical protein